MDRLGNLVVGEDASGVTLVRPLVIVQRSEVERGEAARKGAVGAELENCGSEAVGYTVTICVGRIAKIVERKHRAGGRGGRTTAVVEPARRSHTCIRVRGKRAGGKVTIGLQHRIDLAVADIANHAAAAIIEAGTERQSRIAGAAKIGRA